MPEHERALAAIRAELGGRAHVRAQGDPRDDIIVGIRSNEDISVCRHLSREICKIVGLRGYAAQTVVTAVSELARNIALYAGSGRVGFRIDVPGQMIRVIAEDQGPGIPNLDEILAGSYRSRTGLGRGLLGVRKLATEIDIDTSERGTRVTLAFAFARRSA